MTDLYLKTADYNKEIRYKRYLKSSSWNDVKCASVCVFVMHVLLCVQTDMCPCIRTADEGIMSDSSCGHKLPYDCRSLFLQSVILA